MNQKQTLNMVVLAALAALAGCASAPEKDLGTEFQAMLQVGFRTEGIASVERLKQDASQQACSSGRVPDREALQAIREAAQKTIQPPADGRYLGDWKLGEKLAQDGRGLTWTDKSAEAAANGAGCYNCHQLSEAEVSHGTIGPSLRHYARNHGATHLTDAQGQAAVVYTWGKLNNSWAALPCSNMPRFGHNGMLNQEQMRHLMALLLDPASPVNAP
jgi:sulfur-oxidizing protein SoxX